MELNLTKEDKVKICDLILSTFKNFDKKEENNILSHVGHLTKAQGVNGFKKCDIGTPVFELDDRYIIIMETLDTQKTTEIKYYKETLSPVIKFL